MWALIQLPAECTDANGIHASVIINRSSVPRLKCEMRRWEHHCNQAIHALNRAAYYAVRGSLKTEKAHLLLRKAEENLEDPNVAVVKPRMTARVLSNTPSSVWSDAVRQVHIGTHEHSLHPEVPQSRPPA